MLRFFYTLLSVFSLGSCSLLIPLVNADKCPEDFVASCTGNTLTSCESGFLHEKDCANLTCDPVALVCEGCGDGTAKNLEECDDANQIPNDGCENDCTLTSPPGCGDNTIQALEVCDGTDLNGETCISQGFDSGSLSCNGACDGFVTGACANDTCGDNTVNPGEECDDGNLSNDDGCDDLCQLECGNSSIDGAEGCDDGNAVSGDGCDQNCQIEIIVESEPNDDGAVEVNNNNTDFSAQNTEGPFSADTVLQAAISPLGDEDGVAVQNNTGANALIRFETFGSGGVGTCDVDPDLTLLDESGGFLDFDDDSGLVDCDKIVFSVPSGGTVFVIVRGFDDNVLIPSYFLEIDFL